MGNFRYLRCNERGWRLIRFCQEYDQKIVNSFSLKKKKKKKERKKMVLDCTRSKIQNANKLYTNSQQQQTLKFKV